MSRKYVLTYTFILFSFVTFFSVFYSLEKAWADSLIGSISDGKKPFGVDYDSNNKDNYADNSHSSSNISPSPVIDTSNRNPPMDTMNGGYFPGQGAYDSNNKDNYADNSHSSSNISPSPRDKLRIGFVEPTFTDAAYNNKFYVFYKKYANAPSNTNITTDLNLLNSKLSLYQHGTIYNAFALTHLIPEIRKNFNQAYINVLTDTDVNNGKIFDNRQLNLFDALVLGHQEYVTQKEYDNLKQFVTNGGTLILLDGNVFYAEVKYFSNNDTISLVKGHGWAFNGKTAWKSVGERWKSETQKWVGSNYLSEHIKTFRNNPFGYLPHEENYITNPKDVVLINYNPVTLPSAPKSNVAIGMYELNYGKGKVIAFGIYSDDVIQNANLNKIFTKIFEYYV
ncbi:MAG TPA: N,N-dimethylformamidase beta subunit family domain-containing protein [Candidatus Nitrosocosmicus sp.]